MASLSNLLSYNCFHDASICFMEHPTSFFHLEEERISRHKNDFRPYLALADSRDRIKDLKYIFHTTVNNYQDEERYRSVLDFTFELTKKVDQEDFKDHMLGEVKYLDWTSDHHLFHAALGFYNSGFEDAICISVDGAGALLDEGYEVETIYETSYPASFKKLDQKLVAVDSTKGLGIGFVYAGVSAYLGFGSLNCGKLMGLAPYGKFNPDIPSFLIDGEIDETLWERDPSGIILKPLEHVPSVEKNELHDIHSDLAWRVQKDFETYMINLINKAIDLGQSKNIVLSGGCALNCVANYEYLKHLPEGYKLYVEPCSTDSGTSVGMAMYAWRKLTGSTEIYPIKDLYWGPKRDEYYIL